jgi:outer membrane protein TolC
MNRIIRIMILFLITGFGKTTAQEVKKWTLQDCINYAVENNIGLQRQMLQTESAEADFLKAKMNMLPSLNFGSDAQVGFGRSIDPVTNLITFEQNLSNSYSLSTSFQLFSGFAALNTVSANKFMVKAGIETGKVYRNTLIVNILGAYYQVMYAKGLEDAAKMQLELSEKQLFRIQKMVETGKEALSKQFEMESRASEDKLSYTIAKNSASQALTSLKQMLQLEPGTEFEIVMPDLDNTLITDDIFKVDSVYNIASQTLPRLKAINYELIASRRQVAAAKGNIAPRLSGGGAMYTGFYKITSKDAPEQDPFSTQLKNNNSQALYVSLDIPIFNNYTIGRNIKLAKLRRSDAELKLELEKNSLYTEIENACLNYNRGKDEFTAAIANFEFNKKSFDAVEKKFEAGLVDVTDYSAAKTTLFRAETEALRTKLQLLIRKLTIQFYSTGEYEKILEN